MHSVPRSVPDAGPVLELASGTGRVACALAAEGVEFVGLDRSLPMLRQAEATRLALPENIQGNAIFVESDMANFNLGRVFSLAIVPARSFQALLTPDAQRAALGCIHDHLVPDGQLVLNLFDPRLDLFVPGSTISTDRREVRHPQSGNVVSIEVGDRSNDAFAQVLAETWRFTERDDTGSVVRVEEASLALRWTYRWELRYLLELCGLTVEAEYSDFKGGAPTYGRELILVAQRG